MFARLNAFPIIGGVLDGLRRRSVGQQEKPDIGARLILFGVPAVLGLSLLITQTVVHEAETMLAAAALFVGALLAGFSQVAAWRERILARARPIDTTRVRALNEAGALILLSVHAAVFGAVSILLLTLLDLDPSAIFAWWSAVVLSATGTSALIFVAIAVAMVANLLWDAFVREAADSKKEQLKDFSAGL